MISMEMQMMSPGRGHPLQKIVSWEVRFVAQNGMHDTITSALKWCEENKQPIEGIRPIAVAVGADGLVEPF